MGFLTRFMAGRRGADQLSFWLMIAGVFLVLVSSILSWFAVNPAVYVCYVVLQVLCTAAFVLSLYRMFSRNIAARDRENRRFIGWYTGVKNWFKRDRKNFVYLKCPGCRAQLRVPKGKGRIVVTCPKCHRESRIKT